MIKANEYFKKGISISAFSVLCNAIGPVLNKFALLHVTPVGAAFWISVLTILLLASTRYFYKFPVTVALAKELKWIAFLNTLGVLFLYLALHYLNPIAFGFLGRLYVVFTTAFSILILNEKIGRVECVFTLLALCSSFLVGLRDGAGNINILGISFAVAYTLTFALANLLVKKRKIKTSVLSILFFNNLGTLVVVSLLGIYNSEVFQMPSLNSFYFLSGSAVLGLMGLSALFVGFKYISFRLANLIRSTSPIVIALVSWPFFPMQITASHASGAGLLVISLLGLGIIEKGKS